MTHRKVVIFDKDGRCEHCYASPGYHYGWCLADFADRMFDRMRVNPEFFVKIAKEYPERLAEIENREYGEVK